LLFLWLSLWFTGYILIKYRSDRAPARWAAAVCFFSGCGGFAVVIKQTNFAGILGSMAHYIAPYVLLIFSLHYVATSIMQSKLTHWIKLAALIPPAIMYVVYPVYPEFQPSYNILLLWVGPYVLGANALLLYAYISSKGLKIRQERLLVCLIIMPTTLFSLSSNYILRALNVHDLWTYNKWVIAIEFVTFIYFCAKYGFLGIKLRFEKYRLDSTLRSVISGTSILHHSVKNETIKIEMFIDQISEHKEAETFRIPLQHIRDSASHLSHLMERIHLQTQEIRITATVESIDEIIAEVISSLELIISEREVDIDVKSRGHNMVYADRVHLKEVFTNLLNNALEAMGNKGSITISTKRLPNHLVVTITDDGHGITEQHLSRVMEPFYTTKRNSSLNLGLGLSYCYNVMKGHRGSLEIYSKVGIGTTIELHFPVV
jgi:signal transduction histidine kinase